MSEHQISLQWKNGSNPVAANTYTRNHTVTVNGPQTMQVSAAKDYKGDPACADPEQLMISALASCHMLTFLAIAEMQGYKVESYTDVATGYLGKGENKIPAVTRIELQPKVIFSEEKIPDAAALKRLHAGAHKNCFIANSLKTEVSVAE